jgi:hypothetical protein
MSFSWALIGFCQRAAGELAVSGDGDRLSENARANYEGLNNETTINNELP